LSNQLERSQRRFQHELDQEKQERRSQLEVLATTQKIRPVSYEQKNIEALELAYAAVVKTSLPRHNFRNRPITRKFGGSTEEQETAKYFEIFTENFKAFIKAFDSVTNAFRMEEDKAIYLTPEIELKINMTLVSIYDFYQRSHFLMQNKHENAQKYFDGNIVPKEMRNFDFIEFNSSMRNEWNVVTKGIREELKSIVRMLLKPASA